MKNIINSHMSIDMKRKAYWRTLMQQYRVKLLIKISNKKINVRPAKITAYWDAVCVAFILSPLTIQPEVFGDHDNCLLLDLHVFPIKHVITISQNIRFRHLMPNQCYAVYFGDKSWFYIKRELSFQEVENGNRMICKTASLFVMIFMTGIVSAYILMYL